MKIMSKQRQHILVINPNSDEMVTENMAQELKRFNFSEGPRIECVTLSDGPLGIESQADIESVTIPLTKMVSKNKEVDAFVIACYSDPGLHVCREASEKPVFGIQECGILTAMSRGDGFGVIALQESSMRRHLRYMRQMGVMERLAGERVAELSVRESVSGKKTFEKLLSAAKQLIDLDQADTIILGCAGMAKHRTKLESKIGIPVIEPVQSAVSMAMHSLFSTRQH